MSMNTVGINYHKNYNQNSFIFIFSDYKSKKIKIINDNIKNYNIIKLAYLNDKYDLLIICYFTLKYFLYDKIVKNCFWIIQCCQSESRKRTDANILNFINRWMRMCKYIESDGDSSEFLQTDIFI